jgi:hypothetical protein
VRSVCDPEVSLGSVWPVLLAQAASWVAVGGSGGVAGAEPVAGIPVLIPGFVTVARIPVLIPGFVTVARIPVLIPGFATEAAILMVRTGSVWPVLWRRLVEVLAASLVV